MLGCRPEPGPGADDRLHRRHHEEDQRSRVHRQRGEPSRAGTPVEPSAPTRLFLAVPRLPVFGGELHLGQEGFGDQLHGHEQPVVPLLDQLLTQHVSDLNYM